MSKHLVRIEAVNLDNFIADTQDLSTVRGGGLLLLDAPESVPPGVRAGKIYVGASTGLFEVDLPPDQDIEHYCESIRAVIASGSRAEATFVVDCCPRTDDFVRDHALITASSRWRQMQSPSVVLPAPSQGPCEVDRVRPWTEALLWKGAAFVEEPEDRHKRVSTTVASRREYGVEQKRGFYEKHVQNLPYEAFTNDLSQIADYPKAGKLHRKIALIYLDGNGFGGILRACENPETLRAWSDLQKLNQDSFLGWLMSVAPGSPNSEWLWSGDVISNGGVQLRKENAFRIETLLWGGDEIVWVVPAWTGWWVLQKFFDLYGRLGAGTRSYDPDGRGDRLLTHCASVVFCHDKAPIHRINGLAHRLTEIPKRLIKAASQAPIPAAAWNCCAYQALESFDHLGEDPDAAREKLVRPVGVGPEALLFRGEDMSEVHKAITVLKQGLAKSRLHDVLARIYRDSEVDAGLEAGADAVARAERDVSGMRDAFETLCGVSGNFVPQVTTKTRQTIAWLHVGELWDYMTPVTWQVPEIPGAAAPGAHI